MSKHVQDIEWNGQEIEVHFYFTKGYAAKLWGAPEDCYPGEPDEWEIESIMYKGVDVLPLLDADEILDKLKDIGDDD